MLIRKIFFFALLAASCSGETFAQSDTGYFRLETPLVNAAFPAVFEAAFTEGSKGILGVDTISLDVLELGQLTVESGKLIACDPILKEGFSAFSQEFPKGQFLVELALGATAEGAELVTFSRIKFSDKMPVRWEFALPPGEKQHPITDTNIFCFSVDAATAIFVDSVANAQFDKVKGNSWNKAFNSRPNDFGYIYRYGPHSMAIFTSGVGDGCYGTYVGYDAEGNICRLLIDFALFPWWEEVH